jgi:hypothetical protein
MECNCEECACHEQPVPKIPAPIFYCMCIARVALTFHIGALKLLAIAMMVKKARIANNQIVEAISQFMKMHKQRQKTME